MHQNMRPAIVGEESENIRARTKRGTSLDLTVWVTIGIKPKKKKQNRKRQAQSKNEIEKWPVCLGIEKGKEFRAHPAGGKKAVDDVRIDHNKHPSSEGKSKKRQRLSKPVGTIKVSCLYMSQGLAAPSLEGGALPTRLGGFNSA